MIDHSERIINAISNRDMQAALQPVVNVSTGRYHSFEALARLAAIETSNLIQVSEKCQLGHIVSLQTLEVSLIATSGRNLAINFNLSPDQLSRPEMVDKVLALIDKYDYSPNLLTIELTEQPCESNQLLMAAIVPLAHKGINLSLDDFGVGSQNIARALELPINQLKIDRSLISDIDKKSFKQDVVEAIIKIARSSNVEVIAEGVETRNECEFLMSIGAVLQQGYYHAMPKLFPYRLNETDDLLVDPSHLEEQWRTQMLA
ncbi:EAL domain-containing protein [Vibrio coralliilyticus]|uniref:EAL domain-containing protein n=1 Tax=Vibrio coralliilyticus TaxID=190893 RepID=UPI001E311C55|nr:EAL domain-containing protein [Vibrio coralliilyticus]MCC2525548.1 EAL domain-containing protein [Vibrio coralliilyticus]